MLIVNRRNKDRQNNTVVIDKEDIKMGYFFAVIGGFVLGAFAVVLMAVICANKIESENDYYIEDESEENNG